jgi:rSAM/selenodomain-associated transferase 2
MIGADCPVLDAALIERAFDALQKHRLVFGPARDGGYYLVGLNGVLPQLFDAIPWGTGSVLKTSVERARQIGVEPFLLPELIDVDEPEDLAVWEKARRANRSVSVIIPTLNEAEPLPDTLKHAAMHGPVELIVADGGSRDDTLRIAESLGAKGVACTANRARQMNVGTEAATGETLLFLHADTLLPEKWHEAVVAGLRRPDVVGGAFRFKIREPFRARWLVEATTNLRSRLWKMPYGDQALFVRRQVFLEMGGFPDLPIMEDYEFVRRLRRYGNLALLDAAVLTSGRRWQRLGFLRATLINKLVILGYHCGTPPDKLAALYRNRTTSETGSVRSRTNPRTI